MNNSGILCRGGVLTSLAYILQDAVRIHVRAGTRKRLNQVLQARQHTLYDARIMAGEEDCRLNATS